MLSLQGVRCAYGRVTALSGVSLEIAEGVTGLVGVNGAGKSTLLTTAAGGRRPDGGTVAVGGHSLYGRGRASALARVALMPQTAIFPGAMTALEVVEYAAWMRGASTRTARRVAGEALERVRLGDRAGHRVRTLSGGMQRRVCLAQAIATEPDVLLLDEPSTGLDPEQRRVMIDLLREVRGAVLLSSHVVEDITAVASRVVVLDAGRVVLDGTVEDLEAAGAGQERPAEAGLLALLVRAREAGEP